MKKLFQSTLVLGVACLLLYWVHQFLVQEYALALANFPEFLSKTYVFLFLINLVSYTTVFLIHLKMPTKSGFAFLGFSLVKLMLATAFLWFPLQSNPALKEPIVLHFMTPYLLLLIWEVTKVYQLLKMSESVA